MEKNNEPLTMLLCYLASSFKMKNTNRHYIAELLWLTLSMGLTFLLVFALSGWTFSKDSLDIHVHDTYFVISRWLALTLLFCLVTFIIYFIKEFRKPFSQTFQNWLLLVAGLTLISSLAFLSQTFSQSSVGWTIYPPLSALDKMIETGKNTVAKPVSNLLILIQIIIVSMLLFAVYHWGRQKNENG